MNGKQILFCIKNAAILNYGVCFLLDRGDYDFTNSLFFLSVTDLPM